MTYVIGISHRGVNSILADQRTTYCIAGEEEGKNSAVKTGLLFPGCIFGATGDTLAFNNFLLTAKYRCSLTDNPSVNWEEFLKFVEWYHPLNSKDKDFQLLFSRSEGATLQWFIYDSINGLTEDNRSILTLGSGKGKLDTYIDQYFDIFVRQMDILLDEEKNFVFRQELPSYLFAYYFTQLATMSYQPLVERIGVGGVFTFISQTSVSEFFQKPSLYLFIEYDDKRKHISVWTHHLWFEDNWLIIESTIPR